MNSFVFDLKSIAEVGKQIACSLRPGLPLLLYGQMGAGKTTLTKHIVASLGCDEEVTSPTYTLMQSYQTNLGELWHVDLYRLEGSHQIDELGLDELNMNSMLIIEWPERLGFKVFSKYLKANLSVQGNNRKLIWEIIE